jgi:hypothetical protein
MCVCSVGVSLCMHVCVHACLSVCMYACTKYVCMYVCMYACMYMYVCMHACMYIYSIFATEEERDAYPQQRVDRAAHATSDNCDITACSHGLPLCQSPNDTQILSSIRCPLLATQPAPKGFKEILRMSIMTHEKIQSMGDTQHQPPYCFLGTIRGDSCTQTKCIAHTIPTPGVPSKCARVQMPMDECVQVCIDVRGVYA